MLESVGEFFANPFGTTDGKLSAWRLFLALGLTLMLLGLWGLIFRHIRATID